MNMTLRQIERIDRLQLSRHRPERTPLQKWARFQVFLILSFLAMILAACILMKLGWSPGNQDQIAAEFKLINKSIAGRISLTSQWHKEEEAKIDVAVAELRENGKWNERWDKFSMLGDYGWRNGIDCGNGTTPMPCMSGGYTFSQSAFEKLKVGDLSHDARNTGEASFQSFQAAIPKRP